jgi:HTH-type transcriptional regulator / antitoxin HigA
MPSLNLDRTITAWTLIAETVFVPHTEQEYDRLVELLDSLIDRDLRTPSEKPGFY